MTIQREYPETASDPSGGSCIPSPPNADDVALRLGRIEERLTSLEQLLGELLSAKCEPHSSDLRGTTESQDDATPAPQSPAPVSTSLPPWSQGENDEELDASVRDYVERLLRKNGENSPDPPLESPCPANDPTVAEPGGTTESPDTPEESASATTERNTDEAVALKRAEDVPDVLPRQSDLLPRRLPPERETSLDALREVANLSATAAIRTFEKSQAARQTADRLPLLFIGVACGVMLLYSAFASGQTAMFVGAGAAFVGAALAGSQVLVILRRWLAASQPVETR